MILSSRQRILSAFCGRVGVGVWFSAALLSLLLSANSAFAQSSVLYAADTTGEYQIGPGDQLSIFVWRQDELSARVPVRPDGRISTPLVEDMVAVGKTPTQLASDIEEVLSEYIRSPEVTVIVESFVGTFGAQIRVLGAVVNPGSIAYRERMTLLDVMLAVGGLTEFASGNRARLVRNTDEGTEERRVRLDRLLRRGDLRQNIPMQPGDVIVVPEAIF